ncbi:MAG: DMT family transporter [Paramuribaculum sp.]|nr:DMT family transporter [Paramuribaculum sp.]
MASAKIKGHLSMLMANVLWGLMSPVAKFVLSSGIIAPLLLTDFRVSGAALLFWILSLFMPSERVPWQDLLRLAGAGMLGILLNQGCFILGVGLTSPGEASLITTTMPMWVMLLAYIILGEPITGKKVGGIVLGASGALILVLSGRAGISGGENPTLGDLLVLGAQLSYALYLTLYRNFIRKYSLVTLMKWMFTFATAVAIPVSLPTILSTDFSSVTTAMWGGAAYVVVGGTFVAYIGIMTGQKTLRPTVVGMYNYVQPIVATAVGISVGMDKFSMLKGIAVVLIFSGVYLVTISRAKES